MQGLSDKRPARSQEKRVQAEFRGSVAGEAGNKKGRREIRYGL